MIDTKALNKHILFIVQHYGTQTQGEEHRQEQVANCLTETFIRLMELNKALEKTEEMFHEHHPTIFQLSIQ